MNHPLLSVKALSCERGLRDVFSDIEFHVRAGELLQIVGDNGSGKTSLLRIIAGLLEPSSGQVFCGTDKIYIGHKAGIKSQLTVRENLRFYQIASIEEAAHYFNVHRELDEFAGELSAGQQRRIALARLYDSQSKIWLLDEPLTALDSHGIIALQALIKKQLASRGIVVIASHQQFLLQNIKSERIIL